MDLFEKCINQPMIETTRAENILSLFSRTGIPAGYGSHYGGKHGLC